MNYRVLLLVPEALTFDMLTPEQQSLVDSVFGQYVIPMPGTIPSNGMKVVDAVTSSNFDPAGMAEAGFDWPMLGCWTNEGIQVVPFNGELFIQHLPPTQELDENGDPVGFPVQPVLHEPHRWAGWQELF